MDEDSNSSVKEIHEFTYNENNMLLSQNVEQYNNDGTFDKSVLAVREYDTYGNVISLSYTYKDGKGRITDSYSLFNTYEYDAKGNILRLDQYNDKTGETHTDLYEYDEADRKIFQESMEYWGNTFVDTTYEYSYDEHGELINEYSVNLYDDHIQNEYNYSYTNLYENDHKVAALMNPDTGSGF